MELIRKETNGTVGMNWCQVGLSVAVMVVLFVQMIVLIGMVVVVVVVVVALAMHAAVFCMIVVRVVCRWEVVFTIKWLSTIGVRHNGTKYKGYATERFPCGWGVCVRECLVCSIIDVCRWLCVAGMI